MVKPKAPKDLQRPRRRLGDVIRALVVCPLCGVELGPLDLGRYQVRVIAYRRNTIRLECPTCGLRFSIGEHDLVEAVSRSPFRNAYAMVIHNRHED